MSRRKGLPDVAAREEGAAPIYGEEREQLVKVETNEGLGRELGTQCVVGGKEGVGEMEER